MLYALTSTIYRCIIVIAGVLYPAFRSYKALNRRDGYEQVKWMMYWIVFAAFTAVEVVTDIFIYWFPLYYEAKVAFVLWLVMPMTKGSSFLYRKLIHPNLVKHETDIDQYIAAASNKGCEVLFEFGQHGMNFAATAVLKTANHLKRSYSVGDVSANGPNVLQYHDTDTDVHQQPASNPRTRTRGSARKARGMGQASSMMNLHLDSSMSSEDGTTIQVVRRTRKALHKVDEEI